MSTINTDTYDAFIAAGVPEDKARAAALAVPEFSRLATKKDLLELENRLTWRIVLALGFFAALVTFLDRI